MIYVIVDDDRKSRVTLVKADNKDKVKERLILSESEQILGSFTDGELSALTTCPFAVVVG